MEQRTLRLGDIVDDYCPRERRITNHAIVAIVEDAIRQTRCTTCDAEHMFKQGREPRRRKKEPESLYEQVLADLTGAQLVPARTDPEAPPPRQDAADSAAAAPVAPDDEGDRSDQPAPEEGWPAHRRLIRASLPKIEGEVPPPRAIPEFTMHQRPQPRPGRGFRFGGQNGNMPGGEARQGRAPRGHGDGRGNVNGNGNGNGHAPDGARGRDGSGRSGRRGHGRRG